MIVLLQISIIAFQLDMDATSEKDPQPPLTISCLNQPDIKIWLGEEEPSRKEKPLGEEEPSRKEKPSGEEEPF